MPTKKVPAQKKRLIYIEGAKHRMLYDGRMEQTVFTIIEQMLENKYSKKLSNKTAFSFIANYKICFI